jgi:fructoselysine 6-kinase
MNRGMMTTATVGDCCLDVYPDAELEFVGGNALNVAIHWAGLGHKTSYVGAVGLDAAARRIRDALRNAGVDDRWLEEHDGETGVTVNGLGEHNERVILQEDLGVSAGFVPSESAIASLSAVDWVHAATLDDVRPLAAALRARGVRTSYDFSTRHEMDRLDELAIAFFSCGSSTSDAVEIARTALAGGAELAVVTCGSAGSVAVDATGEYEARADVNGAVCDSCGAGDAYIAAFVDTRLAGGSIPAAMRSATALATTTCGHLGPWPQSGRRIGSAHS